MIAWKVSITGWTIIDGGGVFDLSGGPILRRVEFPFSAVIWARYQGYTTDTRISTAPSLRQSMLQRTQRRSEEVDSLDFFFGKVR